MSDEETVPTQAHVEAGARAALAALRALALLQAAGA